MRRFLFVLALVVLFSLVSPLAAQNLEIHVIDVGWGQATFIKGPGASGKTVLLEAGNTGKGTSDVVPYLKSIGHQPAAGFDYSVLGHQHCDHAGGMDEVINAGYNVRTRNYYNGSSYSSSCITQWFSAAGTTTAGAPIDMAPGTVINLGGGATLTCIASRGRIIGGGTVSVSNENDLSIALLLEYGGFDYYWASDLGGGTESCTGRSTSQVNVETAVIQAISPGGAHPLISSGGIDLLHVSHHGSESSTNSDLFDYSAPAVAVISTGAGQTTGWDLPRIAVVNNVLLSASSCVTAPPTFVVQTEEGSPTGVGTSFSGYCVGDIKITTNGGTIFTVDANGGVSQGPNEKAAAGLPRSFTIDDSGGGGDTTSPTTSITAPASGATVSGTTTVSASAADNVGVTRVEFYLDGGLTSTDTTSPYSWSWNTAGTSNGSHALTSKAFDAAGNSGTSSPVNVTYNGTCTTPGTTTLSAPAAGATGVSTSPTLSWSAVSGATSYDVYLSTASSPALLRNVTTTSTTAGPLTGTTVYYWKVVAKSSCGSGPESTTRSFTTASGSAVTVLTNGVTLSNRSGATGTWTHYRISVPTGQSSLVITTSGGSGDSDLYVKLNAQPTSTVYDYRPYLTGNNETVTVTNPVAGDWYISLYGYAAYSGMSLNATYTGSAGCTSYSGSLAATGASQYQPGSTGYVSSVSGSHTGALTGPSGADFDLYLEKLSGSSWSSVASGEGSTSTENISYSGTAGTYRWRVTSYSGTGSYTLCTTKP